MALRVLLADESTTIKKVMQLALQDFAVEVKAVHAGVDVVEVARTFKPDLIFVDVLLQKKNGYEVGADIKKDSELKSIPVVLMWSSFMDLDENLAKASGAERRLEKPFDAQQLRQLVLDLVPRTRSQRLAHFLDFPKMPVDPPPAASFTPPPIPVQPKVAPPPVQKPSAAPPSLPPTPAAPPPPPQNWNMDSFDDLAKFTTESSGAASGDEHEEFTELKIAPKTREPLSAPVTSAPPPVPSDDGESWSHQDLSRFQIVLPATSVTSDEISLNIDHPDSGLASEKNEPTLTGVGNLSFADYAIEKSPENEFLKIEEESENSASQASHMFGEELSLVESMEDLKYRISTKTEERLEDPKIESLPPLTRFEEPDPIPQMGVDRLEEILRAQSRQIIEEFVRRVLPDLASDIIRSELQRLLEEGPQ
jgi:two-component system, cell cycle response regulator